MKQNIIVYSTALTLLLLAACSASGGAAPTQGMANPASLYCGENGGTLEIRTAADGSQSGFCVFADGSECDEWSYYNGECSPGGQAQPVNPETADDGSLIYRDAEFGYSFHYPADAVIVPNDDPTGGITIEGAEVNGEHWPMIAISHPADRAEYRPPEGADLARWVADNYLCAGERQADLTIAGLPALHFRENSGGQSYNMDRYFLAHNGQLFQIILLHTGYIEDWAFYDQFLASFQFEP